MQGEGGGGERVLMVVTWCGRVVVPAVSRCGDAWWRGDGDMVVVACDGGGGGGSGGGVIVAAASRWWWQRRGVVVACGGVVVPALL